MPKDNGGKELLIKVLIVVINLFVAVFVYGTYTKTEELQCQASDDRVKIKENETRIAGMKEQLDSMNVKLDKILYKLP